MCKVQHAVIAAAGYGSRLNKGMPKCLVDVNGHKIVEYQLALLKDVPDVRLVVGYKAKDVVDFIKTIRSDIKFIVNEAYDRTNTLQSYYLGCHDIGDFFLLMDGDIIPHKRSFQNFMSAFTGENTIGVAQATTEDAVFVNVDKEQQITEFTRTKKYKYEWSNIAILHSDILTYESTYVYQRIEKFLPIKCKEIERLEVDTPADMEYACRIMQENAEYML